MSQDAAAEGTAPRPLLQASAAALGPILAFGCAAAAAPGRTVGSVVIATMGGTLASLGGVVVAARVARRLEGLRGSPAAEHMLCVAALPMLLGATAVALIERTSLALAFLLTLATLAWSRRAVGASLGALRGSLGAGRTAAALAIAAHAPSLFRLALWTL